MSLGGIAIAIGELADAAIVLIENAHVRLAAAPPEADRKRVIVDACKEVGRPIFFSLLLITVSFLPIFTLAGQAGRLFTPLAYTKTLRDVRRGDPVDHAGAAADGAAAAGAVPDRGDKPGQPAAQRRLSADRGARRALPDPRRRRGGGAR